MKRLWLLGALGLVLTGCVVVVGPSDGVSNLGYTTSYYNNVQNYYYICNSSNYSDTSLTISFSYSGPLQGVSGTLVGQTSGSSLNLGNFTLSLSASTGTASVTIQNGSVPTSLGSGTRPQGISTTGYANLNLLFSFADGTVIPKSIASIPVLSSGC
jgi:hypothetical protein